jgi:hypothetical protein
MLFFDARKKVESPLFVRSPMQSDYAAAWLSNGKPATARMPQWIRNLPRYSSFRIWLREISIVRSFDNWLTGQRQLGQFSLKNKRLFKKVQ